MTWILKYLYDNPKLLETVTVRLIFDSNLQRKIYRDMIIIMYYNMQAEQMAIHMSNNENDSHLTWVQTRNMPVTQKVTIQGSRLKTMVY